jgi:hypothetical protein
MFLTRYEGDGYKLGICEKNNQNIAANCILASEQEWSDATGQYKKLNKSIVTGSRVIDWTQTEIDDYVQAQADVAAQAKTDKINLLDDELANTDMSVAITKVDNAIDNIGNLDDAKAFLKKLCRYIILND